MYDLIIENVFRQPYKTTFNKLINVVSDYVEVRSVPFTNMQIFDVSKSLGQVEFVNETNKLDVDSCVALFNFSQS